MLCHNCGKENRADSGFCRHCGVQLKADHPHRSRKPSFIKKISGRMWIVIGALVLISGGTAFAAPKVNDYIAVKAALSNAEQLQSKGDYAGALSSLNAVEGRWTFQSNKQELEDLKNKEGVYIQDQNNFNLAVSKENSGDLNGAQQVLQSIATDFPQYNQIQNEIASVQSKIESQLQSQTLQAQDQAKAAQAEKVQADAVAAQASAQAAQAAKDKADAQAAAAAAAQAQAEANAQAVAEAQAKVQAQADAQHQVLLSFYNQLSSIYGAVNSDGIGYYNNAMNYYNSGSYLVALGIFGQAQAVFQKAYSDAVALNGSFTGLPASYVSAGYSMSNAANDCLQATNIMMADIGNSTNLDANSTANTCTNIKSSVSTFLATTNP